MQEITAAEEQTISESPTSASDEFLDDIVGGDCSNTVCVCTSSCCFTDCGGGCITVQHFRGPPGTPRGVSPGPPGRRPPPPIEAAGVDPKTANHTRRAAAQTL